MQATKRRSNQHKPRKRVFIVFDSANENFWSGVASGLDLFGQFRVPRYSYDSWEADYEALCGDWHVIGQDLTKARRKFEARHHKALYGQERLFDPDETTKVP